MTFLELSKSRYSTRLYQDKPVAREDLEKILEAGRIAPTAKNLQPFTIYVLSSEEALHKVDQLTACRYNAPLVLLIGYDRTKPYIYPEEHILFDSGIEDCAIVMTHMMLEATELGLNTCWINKFSPIEAKRFFGFDGDFIPVAMLDVGYEAEHRIARLHDESKTIDELVKVL